MTENLPRALAIGVATVALSGCIIDDLPLGTGYAAKYMCSGLWVSGLDEDQLRDDFIAPTVKPLPLIWEIDIDYSAQTVTVRDRLFGTKHLQTAYYREDMGCTLTHDTSLMMLDFQKPIFTYPVEPDYQQPWPLGEAEIYLQQPGIDYTTLQDAVDEAFADTAEATRNTLSVAVVHNNQLVFEQYADGVDKETPLLSWSMAKTITATMAGLMYDDGDFAPQDRLLVDAWAADERAAVTYASMLQMNSGIEWTEDSTGENADQGRGLYTAPDMSAYYIAKPLADEPGTVFNYTTGGSNLLAKVLQDLQGGSVGDYYRYMEWNLLRPLGIHTSVLEYDTEGHPVGGAYHYLSTRDWARLGLLYLREGDWFGQQVLSADWINQSLTPSAPYAGYGYQIWLNTDQMEWPSLPESTYSFIGFQGQFVMMIPDYDLVIVRTGVTFGEAGAVDPSGIEALAQGAIDAVTSSPY